MSIASNEVTKLLNDWSGGDKSALDKLIPLVHAELKQLARRYMKRERVNHTLQTSALINEAYLRLINQKQVQWQNRTHFFAIASQLMRRVLVDHARTRGYAKRGGAVHNISFDETAIASSERAAQLIALDEALDNLAKIDPRQSRIVEMRFFGGLSIEETAEALSLSPATIKREWNAAKAWLYKEIRK